MNIEKSQILDLLRSQGDDDTMTQAERELPDQVDTDRDSGLLDQLGIDINDLTTADTRMTVTSTGEGHRSSHSEAAEQGGGKVKAAALMAGVAALANKVRQEAPKKARHIREKRAAGRCVILTEADGHFLAIGPYKSEEKARQDIFKVGGSPHVAELVPNTAFFPPPSP